MSGKPHIHTLPSPRRHFTGEELQVKFLWDSEENSLSD
jgi:hypothetical protein